MVVSATRSFEAGSPVSRYWLARCEGFTVRRGRRVLGAVAEIGGRDPCGTAEYLVVRRRRALRRTRTVVPTAQVTEVAPALRLLVLGTPSRPAHARGRRVARAGQAAAPVATWLARTSVALLGVLLRVAAVSLALSGRALLRVAAEVRRRLPDVLSAAHHGLVLTLLALAWLGRAALTGAHALGARAGPALAELRARRAGAD
jgi:hypothetical protein